MAGEQGGDIPQSITDFCLLNKDQIYSYSLTILSFLLGWIKPDGLSDCLRVLFIWYIIEFYPHVCLESCQNMT